eukprot:gnl/MRDRNA2_/MRDRNA2_89089_c0_seq1.p1 gnl/MRDRNA2_/MRDRNA2_89089_c0~~gnl/MRDRNA2_/MRDRNA2_89089_c0_seq1.p1  ORF type:complete len:296 (+),score=31.34 gnl/MRDRNA2_/MRDRNA2_89089_c0_seq1:60-947(+)
MPVKRSASISHSLEVRPLKRLRASSPRAKAKPYDGPFPDFKRPTPSEVRSFHSELAQVYGERIPPTQSKRPVLDTLVGCILSQNTTNINSRRAMDNLRNGFPLNKKDNHVDWSAVREAPARKVEALIKCGGLAKTKTQRIRNILNHLQKERGKTSLEHLRKMDRDSIFEDLTSFPGVGPKTVSIVCMFALSIPDFAVDTHVFRYAKQLGWVPSPEERTARNSAGSSTWPQITRDSTYEHLNAIVPDDLKYSLHLILTDTKNGLPVHCPAQRVLSKAGKRILVDETTLASAAKREK